MSITELVEQPRNPPNAKLAELQERAKEMARYYYAGFSNTLTVILVGGGMFLEHPERTDFVEDSYLLLKKIEEFYAQIPFDALHRREEFYPLFVIRRLLPNFRKTMDAVVKKQNKVALEDLGIYAKTIANVGGLYGDSLMQLLKTIRQFPEAKDFTVAISDQLKNYTWYF